MYQRLMSNITTEGSSEDGIAFRVPAYNTTCTVKFLLKSKEGVETSTSCDEPSGQVFPASLKKSFLRWWMNEWNMEFGPKAQRWDQ